MAKQQTRRRKVSVPKWYTDMTGLDGIPWSELTKSEKDKARRQSKKIMAAQSELKELGYTEEFPTNLPISDIKKEISKIKKAHEAFNRLCMATGEDRRVFPQDVRVAAWREGDSVRGYFEVSVRLRRAPEGEFVTNTMTFSSDGEWDKVDEKLFLESSHKERVDLVLGWADHICCE